MSRTATHFNGLIGMTDAFEINYKTGFAFN
jgi:hypothetical protein